MSSTMKMPYDFRSWVHLVNGVVLDGFAPGDDAFEFDRNTDSFSSEVGVQGDMSVAISADRSTTLTIKLLANSSSNTYLGTLCDLQEGGPATFVPVRYAAKDTNLQDIAEGNVGYIMRPSKMTRGGKAGEQEWKLVFARGDFKFGGALNVPL